MMGYFSNGTEGDMYTERFCERCIHNNAEVGCPVLTLHWLWNYDQCSNKEKEQALSLLIPRDKDGWNEQCTMFTPKQP